MVVVPIGARIELKHLRAHRMLQDIERQDDGMFLNYRETSGLGTARKRFTSRNTQRQPGTPSGREKATDSHEHIQVGGHPETPLG